MSKSKKGGSKAAGRKTASAQAALTPLDGMGYWRDLAKNLLPDEDDDWKVGEMATTAKLLVSGIIAEHWPEIDRIAGKRDKAAVSFTLTIDRAETPPTVKITASPKVSKVTWKAESDVPDASQNELPGITPEPEPEADPEESPRVRTATEEVGMPE